MSTHHLRSADVKQELRAETKRTGLPQFMLIHEALKAWRHNTDITEQHKKEVSQLNAALASKDQNLWFLISDSTASKMMIDKLKQDITKINWSLILIFSIGFITAFILGMEISRDLVCG